MPGHSAVFRNQQIKIGYRYNRNPTYNKYGAVL